MDDVSSGRKSERSYTDYLHDVAGESYEDELGALNTTGSSFGADGYPTPITTATPGSSMPSGIISPQLTEARSFVNGLLSPFSPLLKQQEQRDEFLQYVSLQPCRKVSVIVRILPCDEPEQRCLFPHLKNEEQQVIRKPNNPRDMVVVNPSAFGKFIPSQVTMETARLVAQVAHISSEDWARLYEFHHVMWPEDQEHEVADDQFGTMGSLTLAIAQDALVERQSSLLISMGQAEGCIGVKDVALPKIISHCQALLEQKAVCTLSMVEILEDKDSFRDLFDRKNKEVSIRHPDMKGAVLEGLTQMPMEDVPGLLVSVLNRYQGGTTIVATFSIWENAVSQQLNKAPSAQITCVEMGSSSPVPTPKNGTNSNRSSHHLRTSRSTVCLGAALRQLLIHDTLGTEPAIAYRESTLTKVLQRVLESSKVVLLASVSQLSRDYESTVVTLNYLRRLLVKPGKMASSPFKTDSQDDESQRSSEKRVTPSKLQEYAKDEHILEQIVADPRQRLAKILKQSPARTHVSPAVDVAPSHEEDYHPIDYMQGLLDTKSSEEHQHQQPWHSPEPDERREPSTSYRGEQTRLLDKLEEPEEGEAFVDEEWNPEEPAEEQYFEEQPRPSEYDGNRYDLNSVYDESNGLDLQGTPEQQQEENPHHFSVEQGPPDGRDAKQEWEMEDETAAEILEVPEEDLFVATMNDSFSPEQDYQAWSPENELASQPMESQLDEMAFENPFSQTPAMENEITFVPEIHSDDESDDDELPAQPTLPEQTRIREDNSLPSLSAHEREAGHADISRVESSKSQKEGSDPDDDLDLHPQTRGDLPELHGGPQEASEHDLSIDDSLISRSESSNRGATRSIHAASASIQDGIRLDIESRQRSAFESLSPSKLPPQDREYSTIEETTVHTLNAQLFERNGLTSSSYRYVVEEGDNPTTDPDEFIGEIHVLEGAVNQIQSMQSGLWKSSAQSLQRLKDSLQHQRQSMIRLASEREALQATVATLKDEMQRNSEEHDNHLQRYEEEVQQVQSQLENVTSQRTELETTVAQTESQRTSLELELTEFEGRLNRSQQQVTASEKAYSSLRQDRDQLEAHTKEVNTRLDTMRRGNAASDRIREELESSLNRLEEAKALLEQERAVNRSTIEDISTRIKRRENERDDLEERLQLVESRRQKDKLELEDARDEARGLGLSLDNTTREKSALEVEGANDKAKLEQLQTKLHETTLSLEKLQSEYRRVVIHSEDFELKLRHMSEEEMKRVEIVTTLKEQCERLQEARNKDGSDKTYWEKQCKKLNRTIDSLEKERVRLSIAEVDSDKRIRQFQEQVRQGEGARNDAARLQDELNSLEKENAEMVSILNRTKAERFEELQQYKTTATSLRNETEEAKREARGFQDREKEISVQNEAESSRLRIRLDDCLAELERSNAQRKELYHNLEAAEGRGSTLSKQTVESRQALEQYHIESVKAKSELVSARDRLKDQAITGEAEKRRFKERNADLEQERARLRAELDSVLKKTHAESHASFALSLELEKAKDDIASQNAHSHRISLDLERSEREKRRYEEKLKNMTSSLHRFESATKERVEMVMNKHQDSSSRVDALSQENRALEARMLKMKRERDAYYRCLEIGRERFAQIALKGGVGGDFLGDVFWEEKEGSANKIGLSSRLASEVVVPDLLHDGAMSRRAEEIAACLALSARSTFKEHQNETSHLRSQVYQLEEEKEIEVATLKTRIEHLERETFHSADMREGSVNMGNGRRYWRDYQ